MEIDTSVDNIAGVDIETWLLPPINFTFLQ